MNYNSSRDKLLFTEYGRNIQDLVTHAMSIEKKEERQNYVEAMVALIEQMHPLGKGLAEGRKKLWKQVFTIGDFKLDVDLPKGLVIDKEENVLKPNKLNYSAEKTHFRHYGQNIQKMVAKALTLEDPELKREYIMVIGSYMKLAYRTWNREHHIDDDVIKADMVKISGGKLEMPDDISLEMLASSSTELSDRQAPKYKDRSNKKSGRNNKQRRKSRGKRR